MKTNGLFFLATLVLAVGPGLVCLGQLPEKRFITKDGKRPDALFAPGIMVGKTLYVAGKGDYRPQAEFSEKVKNCLNEIRKTLQMAGLDMEHVVKCFCYLEDPDKYKEFNQAYAEFFPKNPPARTTLGVSNVPGDSRVEITCIAYRDLREKKAIGTAPSGFPFSQGILVGDTLYVSGKGDQLPAGGHPATFEEQVRQTMKNVETVLRQAGLDFRHVAMSHIFLDADENAGVAAKVYREFFEAGNEPALATVFVDWIPGGSHVEITCFATTDLSRRRVVRPATAQEGSNESGRSASPAVWAGDTLYLSGLSGVAPGVGKEPVDVQSQVRRMASGHMEVLRAAGLELKDIVSGHVYLRDIKDYDAMNKVYREYFSQGPGVRTCLMPNSGYEKNETRVMASFIAARTKTAKN